MHKRQRRQGSYSGAGLTALTALLVVVVVVVCWQADGTARALQSGARDFSSQEQDQLRSGKLVVRPAEVVRSDRKLLGGLSWQVINATPAHVWKVMNDVRAYPRFLPAVDEARFVEQLGSEQRLFVRHRMGFVSASYFVLLTADAANGRMRFRLDRDRPSSIRDAFGELTVSAFPDGQSVVSLAILADVGEGLLAGVVRSHIQEWMLRVPEQLKRHVDRNPARP
jgi:carbon monoxide dehydrogenase subunit G